MAQDLKCNGTPYPERTGADKYGTFYLTTKPSSSGTLTLDYKWGSRTAESAGRAHGLSGFATVHVQWRVDFPVGYFTKVPIIKVYELYVGKIANSKSEFDSPDTQRISCHVENNSLLFNKDGFNITLSANNMIKDISETGFTVEKRNPYMDGVFFIKHNELENTVIFWHAFGV